MDVLRELVIEFLQCINKDVVLKYGLFIINIFNFVLFQEVFLGFRKRR